jgi:hypothetical protein
MIDHAWTGKTSWALPGPKERESDLTLAGPFIKLIAVKTRTGQGIRIKSCRGWATPANLFHASLLLMENRQIFAKSAKRDESV